MKQKKLIALILVLFYLLSCSSAVLAADLDRTQVLKNKDEEIARKFAEAKKWLKERMPDLGESFSQSLAKWKAEAQKMVEQIIEKFNDLRYNHQTLL